MLLVNMLAFVLSIYLGVGMQGHTETVFSHLRDNSLPILHYQLCIKVPISPYPINTWCYITFYFSHPSQYEVIFRGFL